MKHLLIIIFILSFTNPLFSQGGIPESGRKCDTFWRTFDDPENECHPCTNGMEKLLQPLLKFQQYQGRINTVNQTLTNYLNSQQANIDRLVNMQDDMTDRARGWNINNLSGGFSTSDVDYIDNWINTELKTYKNRFGGDYEYINALMNNWIEALESLKEMLAENEAIDEKANEIIRKINSGHYGNLDSLNFDCCPETDQEFNPNQLNGLDELLNDLNEIFDEYFEYKSKMAEMAAHYTELLENILLKRAADEGEMTENRDQYSDGLFAFLIGEMVDGMKTAFSQEISNEGLNLSSSQQQAVNAFAEAAGSKIEALISGGATGVSSALVGDIIELAGENMSPADREALRIIGEQVWSAIAEKIVEKAATKLLEKAGTKFALEGLGSAVSLPITLWEQLITVPIYLWADRDLKVLQGAYDRIVVSLLIAIKLSRDKSVSGPANIINALIEKLKSGKGRAICICFPEKNPKPTDADEYAQAFLKEVFGEGAPSSLSDNDHYDLLDNGEGENAKYLHYVYNNQLRIKVRFPCYCGVYVEDKVTTPESNYNPSEDDVTTPPWEQIELTGIESKFIEKGKKSPIWIPVSGGIVTGGIIVGVLKLLPKEEIPIPPPLPVAKNDQFTVTCGWSALTLGLLFNDTGDEIYISNVIPPNDINIEITGKESIIIYEANTESFDFSYTITDKHGQTSSANVSITVVDKEAPTIICPEDLSISCENSINPDYTGFATAEDNCSTDDQLTISHDDDLSGLTDCNNTGIFSRIWTVTDNVGNLSKCTQQIKVIDETNPEIQCPEDISINADESRDPEKTGFPIVKDNCTNQDELNITYKDDESDIVNNSGTLVREWKVLDLCGNETLCQQKIIIKTVDCDIDITFETQNPDCGLNNGIIKAEYDNTIIANFIWSTGQTGSNIDKLKVGIYTVTVTIPEQNCESEFSIELQQKPVEYISEIEIEEAICPTGGNIILTLDSPGDGVFEVSVFTNGVEKIFSNISKGTTPLNDLMVIDSGEYLITVFDQSLGDTCYQDIEVYVQAAEPYKLELIQLNHPTNSDQNNGNAIFSFDLTQVKMPLELYLNDGYYGQTWEPGFIVENLSVGTHSVYVIDASSCKSLVSIFTLFSDSDNKNSIIISDDLPTKQLYRSMLQKWGEQELLTKTIGEFPPNINKTIHILPDYYQSSPILNINYSKDINNDYSTGIGINVGQLQSIMVINIPDANKHFNIPCTVNGTSININISRNFEWKDYHFSIQTIGGYNLIKVNILDQKSINLYKIKDQLKKSLITANIEFGVEKQIINGAIFSCNVGILNNNQSLLKPEMKPYINIKIIQKIISY